MKIIIVNYRYFVSGGPERYMFNVIDLLQRNGHTVIPFSIQNSRNAASDYEDYFISPVSKGEEVYFGEVKKSSLKTIVKSFSRMFYSFEARRKLDQLIKATNPDLIYVLHYQNKISSSIFDAAKKNDVPVVHRISDFGQICSNALFYRPRQKDICERCLTGSKWNAVANKCVYNSYVYSFIKAASLELQRVMKLTRKVDAFIVPSKFTLHKLAIYGFPPEKLFHIPTFFNFRSIENDLPVTYQPFALYIGRIEEEKGLATLIEAFEGLDFNLKIIGFSTTGFEEKLLLKMKGKSHNIEILGRKDFSEIQEYLRTCSFTIVPSEWYDNFPNTILESFAFKKCVVATNIGSLRELVINGETGLLFELKNAADLRSKINILANDNSLSVSLGENGYSKLKNEFSEQKHYQQLHAIFNNAQKHVSVSTTAIAVS